MTTEEQRSERIQKVMGVCSWCGKLGDCEVGIIDERDIAHAFCNYVCLGYYNVAHGLTLEGEVTYDN
jgi:hypothetical protein